jgi:hypothetical protein
MFGLNPWGFTSVLTAVVSCLFIIFLWKTATPSPVTRRFIVLLVIENLTLLTSSGGIELLFFEDLPLRTENLSGVLHHLGDVLILTLYPLFVAHALPLKGLKRLTTFTGRFTIYAVGFSCFALVLLDYLGIVELGFEPDLPIYLLMFAMFVTIFIISIVGVRTAKTKLAREKAIAFVCAFGIRDLIWATVYFVAFTGLIEKAPMFFTQLYVLATLIYIPIMAYGILKVQMLDIEIRLKKTIKNTFLAGAFVAFYYLISEGVNNLLSNSLGDLIGFVVSALLTLFLSPLHKWAEGFATRLADPDIDNADYAETRSLQVYSASIEDSLAYGEISKGQLVLLDRLRDSLGIPEATAIKLEQKLNFDRLAVAG